MPLDVQKVSTLQTENKLPNFVRFYKNIWQLHFPPTNQCVRQFPHRTLHLHHCMETKVNSTNKQVLNMTDIVQKSEKIK